MYSYFSLFYIMYGHNLGVLYATLIPTSKKHLANSAYVFTYQNQELSCSEPIIMFLTIPAHILCGFACGTPVHVDFYHSNT